MEGFGLPNINVTHNSAPVTDARVRLEITKSRIKNGQCPHCGIQTHKVKKRMGVAYKKVPLNIPGSVNQGSCLREECRSGQMGDLPPLNHHQAQQQQQAQASSSPAPAVHASSIPTAYATATPLPTNHGSSAPAPTSASYAPFNFQTQSAAPSYAPFNFQTQSATNPYASTSNNNYGGQQTLNSLLAQSQKDAAQANQTMNSLLIQSQKDATKASQTMNNLLIQSQQQKAQANKQLNDLLVQSQRDQAQASQDLQRMMGGQWR